MLGLEPSISCQRFSGLRFASPENDDGFAMSAAPIELPRWADTALVPLVSVAAALAVSGLVVIGIGESPLEATALLLRGALGSAEGIGFTLYYTTNFIFTGLAVAVAFHAGLFNIGGEGQATIAGIFAALACLWLAPLPGLMLVPLAILAAAPPIMSSPAVAILYGFEPSLIIAGVIITTVASPIVAPMLVELLAGAAVPLDRWVLTLRLLLFVGGGMAAAVASWLKLHNPNIRIIGVEGVDQASMKASVEAGQPVTLTQVEVPQPEGAALTRLCNRLGLDFAAADFMTDADGSLVFLEVNSQPMFAAFDRVADGALCNAIIDHLSE